MAAEPTPRLTQLPGFDTAPDVYETAPDDSTTTTASTSRTSPPPSDTSSEDEDEGVSRRRLNPDRARNRFGLEARGIGTKKADLSDRVDGLRRGYRRGAGEEESLEERIARLRREVEECRVLAEEEKEKGEEEDEDDEAEGESLEDVDALSRLLAGIEVPPSRARKTARRRGSETFHDALPTTTQEDEDEDFPSSQTLSKIAAFDARLAALETSLGLSSLESTTETPLLPSLNLLDSQLATLNSATSLAALEAASTRISKLKTEAQNLSQLQLQTGDDEDEDSSSTLLSPNDMEKLHSLFSVLPTLQSLAPTVPALITRLRSLRTLHTTAASASADLDSVEQRQAEMDKELKMWRNGLEKVEQAVKYAHDKNGENGAVLEEWIEDLRKRMTALGR